MKAIYIYKYFIVLVSLLILNTQFSTLKSQSPEYHAYGADIDSILIFRGDTIYGFVSDTAGHMLLTGRYYLPTLDVVRKLISAATDTVPYATLASSAVNADTADHARNAVPPDSVPYADTAGYVNDTDIVKREHLSPIAQANLTMLSANATDSLGINGVYIKSWGDIKPLYQNTTQGAKDATFRHHADSAGIGAYTVSTSSAATIDICNLSSGMQGTIYLAIGTNPSGVTVNTFSDEGTTALTPVILGNTISTSANKSTSITYTCVNNGTSTLVYLVYGQEN